MKISYDDNDIHSSIPYIYYTIEKKRHPTRSLPVKFHFGRNAVDYYDFLGES